VRTVVCIWHKLVWGHGRDRRERGESGNAEYVGYDMNRKRM
jgi:hypothetical protein